MTAALKIRDTSRFEIVSIDTVVGSDCLRLTVDAPEQSRCYVVDWSLHTLDLGERLAVVKHAETFGDWETSDLCPNDIWELGRWLECNDDLADRVADELLNVDPR